MKQYLFWLALGWALAQSCGYWYVSPTGTATAAGTPADPLSLQAAITQATTSPIKHIRLAIGDYPLSAPLNVEDNIILEGGFDLSGPQPVKRSDGITRLRRLSGTPEANPCRLVAVQAIGKTGFELHDLYIEVENASYTADGPSCSTYGLYLSGCSNYQIVRCRIHAGDATDGKPGDPVPNGRDGAPGQKGQDGCRQCQPGVQLDNNQGGVGGSSWSGGAQAGGNGGNGGPIGTGRGPAECWDLNFCNGASAPPGQPGQNGNTAVAGQIVGIGGAAGSGQNICSNFTDAAGFIGALGGCPSDGGLYSGQDGLPGAPGRNGADGSPGAPTFAGGWFIPGNGQDGQPGEPGSGGGGGGGGGSLGGIPYDIACFQIDDGYTNSSGGGGGGGGEGGEGGPGGKGGGGGGGAFAVFLWNNGANGGLRDCPLTVGTPGQGAIGSAGGLGGRGGEGGCGGGSVGSPCQRFCGSPPYPDNTCAAGCQGGLGGNGGRGGDGGNGGRGGDGANGIAQPLYQSLAGTPALVSNTFVPTEPPIAVSNLLCSHSEVSFTVSNADPLTTYEWAFGVSDPGASPLFAQGPAATATFSSTGFKTIILRVNGVPFRYTLFVSPTQPGVIPQIQPQTPLPICQGGTATFQANLTNPANRAIIAYEWQLVGPISAGPVSGASATFTTPPLTQTGTYKVYLRVQSECCGWSVRDSLFFDVVSQRTMTAQLIATPPAVCEGEPITLILTNLSNQGTSPTIVWRKNGTPIAGAFGTTYIDPSPQNGDTYEVQITSSEACISNSPLTTNSVTAVVRPRPQLTCPSPLSAYLGYPTTFTINASNASALTAPFTYAIDLGNGFTINGQSNTLPISANANYGGAGTYTATITLTDANGCANQCAVSINISTNPPPTVDFTATPTQGCDQLTATFTATPANADEYRWDFGDGTPPLSATSNTIQHTYTQVGFYTVRVEVRLGATWLPAEKIHYIQVYKTPSPQIGVLSTACENQPIQFADLGQDGYIYSWDFGDGNTSTQPSPQHVYAASGTYNVTLTAASHNGLCSATVTRQVTVAKRPIAAWNLPLTEGCLPLTLQPDNTSNPNGTTITQTLWIWGDGGIDTASGAGRASHTYTQPGRYPLWMVVVSADGCTDTIKATVTVHPRPQAAFAPTQVVQRQPETQVAFTNQSQGATAYVWDFGNGTTATDPNPVVDFAEPGTYPITLVAYNAFGCTDTARGLVVIEPGLDIFIPNVFTPNGDGINDEWNIRTSGIPYQVWVYDRWGNLVFEGNASRLWNGRHKNSGSDCPEGAYTYKLVATLPGGQTFTRTGTVTLLR